MSKETLNIPNMGGSDGVEVIEICVAVGDNIEAEQSVLVLESDKASMEVPAPKGGKVLEILVKEGDTVNEGDDFIVVETEGDSDDASDEQPEESTEEKGAEDKQESSESNSTESDDDDTDEEPEQKDTESKEASSDEELPVSIPDIGTDDEVDLIELCVAVDDTVAEGDSLIVLETDKASMEVPSPAAGKILSINLAEGDKVKKGDLILTLASSGNSEEKSSAKEESKQKSSEQKAEQKSSDSKVPDTTPKPDPDDARDHGTASKSAESARLTAASEASDGVYAGPAVRRMAREFGLDLNKLKGSGPKGRLVKEDLQSYVKKLASGKAESVSSGSGIPAVPDVDFSQFGEVSIEPRTKMAKLTAKNMHRSWLNVPHVSHFDEADITELESFRKEMKAESEKAGVKITPIPFLIKACALALKTNPAFNVSISQDGENVIQKHYYHIGMAVDTPAGLLVPVLKDADKKSVYQIAEETAELAAKAKDRKLKPAEMQGGCFTISSLGGIGGTGFTPIVNTPEVGILGVSKLETKPKWNGSEFVPRQMLPLILSYDHRAINGGDAGRFMTTLTGLLSDIRRMLL